MRTLIYSIALASVAILLTCCKTKTVYVPVESIRTEKEYIDKWHRDSIYVQDSIIINRAGDTIYVEKHKYIYIDKLVRDSVFLVDSVMVEVPYPVIEIKEVNRLKNWQIILMCLGAGLIAWLAIRSYRFFK